MQETTPRFGYRLIAEDGAARMGEIATPHGRVRTPAFMPVGTAATVKALYPEQVKAAGADIVLANTYHLMLRPGAERVAKLGGLHAFMRWDGPILTDSGGFQVMSLGKLREVSEEGVRFQSHIDGAVHMLTPERAIEIQCLLGADIQMQLDECLELPAERAEAERAMELSLRWAERSRAAFERLSAPGQALFAIVQGATDTELRRRSAEALVAMDFPGYAVGGLAVGEGHDVMLRTLDGVVPLLPAEKPRYLMGVGTPLDLIESVARGHRHVRLRAADAQRAPRPRLHLERARQPQERLPRRGPRAARSDEHLPGGARLLARLPAPPRQVGRAPGLDAAVVGEHGVLPGADGGDAGSDRGSGALRRGPRRPSAVSPTHRMPRWDRQAAHGVCVTRSR